MASNASAINVEFIAVLSIFLSFCIPPHIPSKRHLKNEVRETSAVPTYHDEFQLTKKPGVVLHRSASDLVKMVGTVLVFEKLHGLAIRPDKLTNPKRVPAIFAAKTADRDLVTRVQTMLGPTRSG